ncbi:hypothetical protein F0562_030658 [Nyssa sinensis]|uniref:Uncharacterized protein n=1 Tax=Nyssa sinensis TaxID=561372 RepID=A0A5J5AX13_9ASTE|nr:hypothetical protein F0562_030658 [Nyssa sinensis]
MVFNQQLPFVHFLFEAVLAHDEHCSEHHIIWKEAKVRRESEEAVYVNAAAHGVTLLFFGLVQVILPCVFDGTHETVVNYQ